MVKPSAFVALVSSAIWLSGCAKDHYDQTANRALTGAAVGAAIGAAAGAATNSSPVTGAVVGATAGAAIGSVIKGPVIRGRQYYRDSRGYCYYINRRGQPVYDYKARC